MMTSISSIRFLFLFVICSLLPNLLVADEFSRGLLPENPDTYALVPKIQRYRANLPEAVDLSQDFPTPGSQGKQGSCTAWATNYAAHSFYEKKRQGWSLKDPDHLFSPAFIYNQLNRGNCQTGSSISSALDILTHVGSIALTEFPYSEDNCSRIPDASELSGAQTYQINGYKRLDEHKLDDIKGQLFQDNPVIVGLWVNRAFDKLRGNEIYDDLSSDQGGGHAMVVVGYDENKQAFKLINSWGKNWGENGFGWISYAAFDKRIRNAFVMEQKQSNSKPIIQVEPQPNQKTDLYVVSNTVAELISHIHCAQLDSKIDSAGIVTLQGFAGKQEDINELIEKIRQLGVQVNQQTVIHPWPQCEAFVTFHDALEQTQGLKISVKGSNSASLSDGELLEIDLTTPSYPSYLYLTYIQANGEAVHLIRPERRFPKPVAANSHINVGSSSDAGGTFRISAPFGNEMLVLVASASPLFDEDLPQTQTEREYLTQFRKAFLYKPNSAAVSRQVSASAVTLLTYPKP
jgi:C1A family cysteine protease